METAFDYRRYRFLDLLFSPFQCVCSYKLTIKAIRFFASVDIFTVCSDRTPTADAILKTTSLARRYGISSFATHGPLSATVFMVLYLKIHISTVLSAQLNTNSLYPYSTLLKKFKKQHIFSIYRSV